MPHCSSSCQRALINWVKRPLKDQRGLLMHSKSMCLCAVIQESIIHHITAFWGTNMAAAHPTVCSNKSLLSLKYSPVRFIYTSIQVVSVYFNLAHRTDNTAAVSYSNNILCSNVRLIKNVTNYWWPFARFHAYVTSILNFCVLVSKNE